MVFAALIWSQTAREELHNYFTFSALLNKCREKTNHGAELLLWPKKTSTGLKFQAMFGLKVKHFLDLCH